MLGTVYFFMSPERTKGAMLIVTSLALFPVPCNSSQVTLWLLSLGAESGLYAVMPGWISVAIFILPLGRFPDIIGHKRIFFGACHLLSLLIFRRVNVSHTYYRECMIAVSSVLFISATLSTGSAFASDPRGTNR